MGVTIGNMRDLLLTRSFIWPLSRGAHVQFKALMMSSRPFKLLIVVTSEGEAKQRFVPGQTCFREKVIGGTR